MRCASPSKRRCRPKVAASWAMPTASTTPGAMKDSGEEFVTMVLATIISGGGATPQQDGWHAVGPECCFGALTSRRCRASGIFLSDHHPPLFADDRFGRRRQISAAAPAPAWEVEPLYKDMLCIGFGEGRRIPAMGAAGAKSQAASTPKSAASSSSAMASTDVERKNILADHPARPDHHQH